MIGLIKKTVRKVREGMLKEILRELRWIYRYGLRYKGSILWYLCLGVFGTAMGLWGSIVSKYIIDAVTGYDFEGILPAAVCYILMQLLMIGSNAWTGQISAKIELKVDQEIRADVYDRIMEADWEVMSEFHSGDLLNRVDNDVRSVSASVIGWVPDFAARLIQFAGALGVILYYDPTLALLALLSAPVTIAVSRHLTGRMRSYNQNLRIAGSELMAFSGESFRNIQTIKSFGIAEMYGKKLRSIQKKYRDVRLDYNRFSVFTSAFMSLVGTGVYVVCFGWGVYRLWTGHITYGTMALFLQMSSSLTASFSALVQLIPGAVSAATAAGRIMAVTDLPKERRECEEQVRELAEKKEDITVEINGAYFHYSTGKQVLQDADLVAYPGEIVALTGPSGEGKTTMLRILLGIVNVQKGTVTVRGREQNRLIPVSAAARPLFSYVPQENVMFAGTIEENLRMMKEDATEEEMNEALKIACAYDFVHNMPLGLNSCIKENGGGFSQGQIQRLAIARAVLSDAPVLLLDEATSALDTETEQKVLCNIRAGKQRRTCIVTAHRPGVLCICDRIYRIENCRIEEIRQRAGAEEK